MAKIRELSNCLNIWLFNSSILKKFYKWVFTEMYLYCGFSVPEGGLLLIYGRNLSLLRFLNTSG
jgi:hypothetical protein